jgi:hypothetical protein
MQRFIIIITSDRPFNAEHHPKFFEFLLSKSHSVRISDDAFCFEEANGITFVRAQLESHLKENDEFALFQVSRASWGTSRDDFDSRMREVFPPPG